MNIYPGFYFRPAKGEQINTVIAPSPDGRAAICGRVVDKKGAPVADALALLFKPSEHSAPEILAAAITDSDGQFIFGPLEPETLYLVKIFKNDIKLRELEIVAD